jgi:hypothetical protein
MKQIYRHSIAASLFFMSTLLLCLGSCQSSDNTEAGEGATVAGLPLRVQIGAEASSRVGMTDNGGDFSCYWNLDKLNIYHQYVFNGIVQSMDCLEFATTAMSGTLADFSCTDAGTCRYNPGSRLYAFSSNTSGGYTASVDADGTSTLTVYALADQLGTLTDCAQYDALYGSANVNFNTGLPESLIMHHLFGMLNLHLTSSSFSTNHPVTVTLNSPESNILPGDGGTAILAANGSTLTTDGSWGTSWSTTIRPTTNGEVDVYFMTWPFSAINGTLTVSCSDGSGYFYIARSVTLSGFSLAAAQLKSKSLAITNGSPT